MNKTSGSKDTRGYLRRFYTNGASGSNTATPYVPPAPPISIVADFDAEEGVTEAGGVVSAWQDTTLTYTAEQATGSRQPAYVLQGDGKYEIEFDGTDDCLVGAISPNLSPPLTVYFVCRQRSWRGNPDMLLTLTTGGYNRIFQAAGASSPELTIELNGAIGTTTDALVDTRVVLVIQLNGTSSRFAVNDGSWTTLSDTNRALTHFMFSKRDLALDYCSTLSAIRLVVADEIPSDETNTAYIAALMSEYNIT